VPGNYDHMVRKFVAECVLHLGYGAVVQVGETRSTRSHGYGIRCATERRPLNATDIGKAVSGEHFAMAAVGLADYQGRWIAIGTVERPQLISIGAESQWRQIPVGHAGRKLTPSLIVAVPCVGENPVAFRVRRSIGVADNTIMYEKVHVGLVDLSDQFPIAILPARVHIENFADRVCVIEMTGGVEVSIARDRRSHNAIRSDGHPFLIFAVIVHGNRLTGEPRNFQPDGLVSQRHHQAGLAYPHDLFRHVAPCHVEPAEHLEIGQVQNGQLIAVVPVLVHVEYGNGQHFSVRGKRGAAESGMAGEILHWQQGCWEGDCRQRKAQQGDDQQAMQYTWHGGPCGSNRNNGTRMKHGRAKSRSTNMGPAADGKSVVPLAAQRPACPNIHARITCGADSNARLAARQNLWPWIWRMPLHLAFARSVSFACPSLSSSISTRLPSTSARSRCTGTV